MGYASYMKHPVSAFPFFLRRFRGLCCTMVGVSLLAGCQAPMATVKITPTPTTLIYSYIIAHGMARGRVMSGDLAPQDVIRLAQADQMALLSVLMAEKEPSYKNIRFAKINGEHFLRSIESGCR
ncbi:hypothetical protein FOH24_08655 [Acetobacter tropicalis]|uniref:hypothetical protein n=2 Tax=Acetobacter tropicalis TaxID=104102 RepID=UPI00068925C4|nr:hypothetical protein [Acetobacter tropicalis]KAA8389440.1 hypothetical protein FOH22_05195 [Acetobacter tropicalis]KAA8390904.1 hypothetical protein FOH24_08655 [Acetobacter tropicalis]MDO8170349.1 hypothetical protein [Acetobacter tropicalis]